MVEEVILTLVLVFFSFQSVEFLSDLYLPPPPVPPLPPTPHHIYYTFPPPLCHANNVITEQFFGYI